MFSDFELYAQCTLSLVLYTIATCGVTIAFVVLYRVCLHPLANVPGPRLAAVSNIWHAYHASHGQMLKLATELHRHYGPVVRVGPNEVWFDCEDAFKAIYGAGHGFDKSEFYLATLLQPVSLDWSLGLHFTDTLDLLSERDKKRYRLQRRLIGPTYQMTNLKRHEAAVDAVLARIIQQIKSLQGAEVDLKEWMHIIVVECLAAVVLSWSPGYLRDKSDHGSSSHSYQGWRRKSVFGLFPLAVKLELLSPSIGRLFARLWGVVFKPPKNFKPFFPKIHVKLKRRIDSALQPKPNLDPRKDLLADLIQLHKDRPEFTETYLRRMAITNFGAGHETMCSALTAAMAMIGSNVAVQARVASELSVSPDALDFENATKLRYTQASIKEAQRLYPVVAMSLSRTVPATGLRLHGHSFPSGTTVGCSPLAFHRNKDIFGRDADGFNPERWLDSEAARRMDRCNLIWGGAPRTCPGRHLAELIIYKAVPALLREFELQVDVPPTGDFRFYFMAMLTGVRARFVSREESVCPRRLEGKEQEHEGSTA